MPIVKCLLIVPIAASLASPAFAEASRAQRDIALQALQLSDGIALNTARKGSLPAGMPPGVYPNRERESRVVCVRERVQAFGSNNPAQVEIVTVCAR